MAAQPITPLPSAFINSYNRFIEYPKSLVPRSIDEEHDEELFALYMKRIEDRQSSAEPLLLGDSIAPGAPPKLLPQIIIRDIFKDGSVLKKKILDETRLGKHLAGFPKLAQANWPDHVAPDPRCRFVYLPTFIFIPACFHLINLVLTEHLHSASCLRETPPAVCK
jgi:hypothetical protein